MSDYERLVLVATQIYAQLIVHLSAATRTEVAKLAFEYAEVFMQEAKLHDPGSLPSASASTSPSVSASPSVSRSASRSPSSSTSSSSSRSQSRSPSSSKSPSRSTSPSPSLGTVVQISPVLGQSITELPSDRPAGLDDDPGGGGYQR